MILKITRYLSAYNVYINMKLRIGNRELGPGNWFLVSNLSKRL